MTGADWTEKQEQGLRDLRLNPPEPRPWTTLLNTLVAIGLAHWRHERMIKQLEERLDELEARVP